MQINLPHLFGGFWGVGFLEFCGNVSNKPQSVKRSLFPHSELANAGRPLFPGNDVDDQLKRIFRYPLTEVNGLSRDVHVL